MNHRFTRAATTGAFSAILALTLAACAAPSTESAPEQTPSEAAIEPNAADVMFVGLMIPHHEEAVEMSDLLLAKEGVDDEVVELAEAIKAAQEPEIEQMQAWLDEWESMPAEGMGGMDHSGDGGMGGAGMSEEDMDALADASGAEANDLFLELMIEHHEGAIEMAQDELDEGQHPDVLELARAIVDSQSAEIELMREMLAS